jgi:hypothetical protein
VNLVIVWLVAGVELAGLVALAVLLIVTRQKLKGTRRELIEGSTELNDAGEANQLDAFLRPRPSSGFQDRLSITTCR